MSHLTLVPNDKVIVHVKCVRDKHDPKYPVCGYEATAYGEKVAMHMTLSGLKEIVQEKYPNLQVDFVEHIDEE